MISSQPVMLVVGLRRQDMIDIAFHPIFPLDKRSLHYFSVLGRALFTAQQLEMNCRAIVGFLHMRKEKVLHGSSVLGDPSFLKGIDKLWRKTLGQNVNFLTELCVLSDEAGPIFREAVQARNEITHSVTMDVYESLDSELDERLDYILKLVRKIATADKVASAIINLLNKDPLPSREFFEVYEDRVVSWVAKETF